MLTGGCQCGRVRYETEAEPFHPTLCHCVDCRRASASPTTAWFTVPAAALRWTGEPPLERASSAGAVRSFCPACGTQLTFCSRALPAEVDVATCSLDDPARVPPLDQVWTEQRVPWLHLDESLPALPRGRAG